MTASAKKSGYERATLLELRIARVLAWLLFGLLVALMFVWITGSTIVINGHGLNAAHEFLGCVVLFVAACMAGLCEARADKSLREIWRTERGLS